MPDLNGVLETALYVEDLDRAGAFYETVMALEPILETDRMRAYDVAGRSIFLLFVKGGTLEPITNEGGTIPPHDGDGRLHMAFGCGHAALADWERHLAAQGVEIESRMDWPRGGKSIYFRDPDGHLLEIAASPGLWRGH